MNKLPTLTQKLLHRNPVRHFRPEVRKKIEEKKSAKNLALEYFDFFYSSTFGTEWNQMRLAMLTGRKYVALVNNYANRSETMNKLEKIAAIDLFDHASKMNSNNLKEKFASFSQKDLDHFMNFQAPPSWKVYVFDNDDTRDFPAPTCNNNTRKLYDYYCMDGASLLPVLALDIKKGDSILDLCSSPGGKTVSMLQTMLPGKILCQDIKEGRLERLKRTLKTYLSEEECKRLIDIRLNEGVSKELFDRVLIDAPCTNDRLSLNVSENNIFSRNRTQERSDLPKKQSELLAQGVLSCKINGTIVYSTCSLSPMQNEGVVNSVLSQFQNNSGFDLVVEPLEYLKLNLSYFFEFSKFCKLGLIVTPNISKNFGPFYLCKLTKRPK